MDARIDFQISGNLTVEPSGVGRSVRVDLRVGTISAANVSVVVGHGYTQMDEAIKVACNALAAEMINSIGRFEQERFKREIKVRQSVEQIINE